MFEPWPFLSLFSSAQCDRNYMLVLPRWAPGGAFHWHLSFPVSQLPVTEALFCAGVAERTPVQTLRVDTVPQGMAGQEYWVWNIRPSLLTRWGFHSRKGKLRLGATILAQSPDHRAWYYSGRSRPLSMPPVTLHLHGDTAHRDSQVIRTERSTDIPKGTNFIWKEEWEN